MDIYLVFFPLFWVVLCAISAICVRLRFVNWPQSLLVGSVFGAVGGICGMSPGGQAALGIMTALGTFVTMDLLSLRSDHLRAPVPPKAPVKPTTKPAVMPTVDPSRPAPRSSAGPAATAPSSRSKPAERFAATNAKEVRKESSARQNVSDGARKRAESVDAAPQPAVEVIMPAERAVLRRKSTIKGYWVATTPDGEKEVYLPPGAEAYPGRPISVVMKPNGTLMGVPLGARA